jgi:hypothetical protein
MTVATPARAGADWTPQEWRLVEKVIATLRKKRGPHNTVLEVQCKRNGHFSIIRLGRDVVYTSENDAFAGDAS